MCPMATTAFRGVCGDPPAAMWLKPPRLEELSPSGLDADHAPAWQAGVSAAVYLLRLWAVSLAMRSSVVGDREVCEIGTKHLGPGALFAYVRVERLKSVAWLRRIINLISQPRLFGRRLGRGSKRGCHPCRCQCLTPWRQVNRRGGTFTYAPTSSLCLSASEQVLR